MMAIALWRRAAFTRWLVPLFIALSLIYELAILGLFAQVPINNERWFLYSFLTVALVSFTYWALNRSAVIPYYLEDKPADK